MAMKRRLSSGLQIILLTLKVFFFLTSTGISIGNASLPNIAGVLGRAISNPQSLSLADEYAAKRATEVAGDTKDDSLPRPGGAANVVLFIR